MHFSSLLCAVLRKGATLVKLFVKLNCCIGTMTRHVMSVMSATRIVTRRVFLMWNVRVANYNMLRLCYGNLEERYGVL